MTSRQEVMRARMTLIGQVTITLLPETWVHPWLLMSKMSPQWPCPTPPGPKTFPGMNQQERMLPAPGQWQRQQPGSSHRDNEAAVDQDTRYAWASALHPATSNAEPGATRRLRLLPVTHQAGLAAQS